MSAPIVVLLAAYALALVLLSLVRRERGASSSDFLLAGRRLTLPAFVATLVTTWYGGILGVGEYAWRYGISTWIVFGVPYYLAAVLFGLWLAPRLRRSDAASIPELLGRAYGPATARTGAAAVLAGTLPVAYALMLGTLLEQATGLPGAIAIAIGVAFSAGYVALSGFRAVVRTDALQMVLMYGGFALLLPAALGAAGGLSELWSALPPTHRSADGGLGWQRVLVWYLIAFQTMAEPVFYQRAFAARSPRIARSGVLLSVLAWMVFDALSITTGLAARVVLPDLADPLAAYPALAAAVLPPLLAALFTVALFAIVMSTLDSYLFVAAGTIGYDLLPAGASDQATRRRTRLGLLISAALAGGGAVAFDSAVQVWHHLGSVVTSALLLPVLAVHLPERLRYRGPWAAVAMIAAAVTATLWLACARNGVFLLGIEPMFPALAVSAACWLGGRLRRHPADVGRTP